MTDAHSTPAPTPGKPAKPYPDFPLYPHATRRWAKKIRGKLHYFGPWEDPDAALAKYLAEKDALHAGRKPKADTGGATVKDLTYRFLDQKQTRVDVGQLSPRTLIDYHEACAHVVKSFGKHRLLDDLGPDDFAGLGEKLVKQYGPHRFGKTVQCVRCLFKFAYEAGLIAAPMRFGPGFQRPSKKTLRLHRAKQGPKLFTRDEVHKLLGAASTQMKAMILLGVNAALGNSDIGNLPTSAANLETGWIDYPRPKTGIERRCPLWPETIQAIREALADRPEPKDAADADRVFITRYGYSWAKDAADSPITKEFRKLLNTLRINGHRNFYALRHTFRTIGDKAKDQPACDFIMGHESPHMSSLYREEIDDQRLKAVTDYVHAWLFGS